MKKQLSKKLFAFIVTAMMFSASANAQSKHASVKTQSQKEVQTQPQKQKQIQKQPQEEQTASINCHCNIIGYGCGANVWCKKACYSLCHNHYALISNDEFNSTTIAFYVEEKGKVSLRIYDLTGRLVTTLADNSFEQGEHSLSWDIKDEKGNAVVQGIYSLRMNAGENSETEKLIVMK